MSGTVDHHAGILSLWRDLSTGNHSLYRDFAAARNLHDVRMAKKAEDINRVLDALRAFYDRHQSALESPARWAAVSGVSYNALNEPLTGAKSPDIKISTLEALADGATRLLNRRVSIDEIVGRDAQIDELDNKRDELWARLTPFEKKKLIESLQFGIGVFRDGESQ